MVKEKNKILETLLLTFTSLLVIFGGVFFTSQKVYAKDLQNAISSVLVWDDGNGREATKNADGTYVLLEKTTYSLQIGFDLSAYDNNLADGDTFTFGISPTLTVNDATIQLVDKDTGVSIGEATVTSKGANQGASVTITMKNLQEYLKKKNAATISGVKGQFFVKIFSQTVGDGQKTTIDGVKDTGSVTIPFNTNKPTVEDNSGALAQENFAKYGGVLTKKSYTSAALNQSGDYVHPWRIRLNGKKSQYTTYVVDDQVSDKGGPMRFIPETFKLTTGDGVDRRWQLTNPVTLKEGVDYTITFNSSYSSFTLTIINPQAQPYMLDYETTAPADGSTVGNIASVTADGKKIPISDSNKTTDSLVERFSKIVDGGTIQLDIGYRIVIYKLDEETNQPLKGASFELTRPNGTKTVLADTDDNGRTYSDVISEAEAKSGDFTITEIKAPDGYTLNSNPTKVTVGKSGAIRTFTNARNQTVKATKVWNDGDNQDGKRPDKVTVHLNKTVGGVTSVVSSHELTAAENWTYDFTNLPKYENGQTVAYSVTEDTVANYDAPVITGDQASGFTITNSRTPETISAKATKVWNDENNQDGKRPDKVTIHLNKTVGGSTSEVASYELAASENWTHDFTNLPKYEGGKEITYSVSEDGVDNYDTPVVTGDQTNGFTITNTRKPEVTSAKVTKIWDDSNNQDGKRPEKITAHLHKTVSGVTSKVTSHDLTATENWTYDFTNLPKYEAGQEITYSVTEDGVDNYDSPVIAGDTTNGFTITNTHKTETIIISGNTVWNDTNNQSGKRPSQILVNIKNGTEIVETVTVSPDANGNWSFTSKELPKYANGKEITYTVETDPVADYKTPVITGDQVNGFTITIANEPAQPSPSNNDQKNNGSTNTETSVVVDTNTKATKKTILPKTGEQTSLVTFLISISSLVVGTSLLATNRGKKEVE
ncbi:MAG: Cna B-type domain-containing protein [Streptococcus sp.]|nr:Cna B-type domain-containing protein [Streptococcus sp.]